jgi:xylulokinase
MSLLLGIDVGTGSIKAVAYDPAAGRVIAVARQPTLTHHPRPDWSEFHAQELWAGTTAAIREVVDAVGGSRTIEAVSIASMGEAGVPLDARGEPLAPMIAWYDLRTESQAAWWRQQVDPFTLYGITGQIIEAKYSVNKLLWLRQHQAEVFARTHRWLCVEDLILWKLSGELVTDYSLASRTMLFDQRKLDWSDALLEVAGLPRSLFPTALPSGTRVGRVTVEAARATGLGEHTQVVTGGHDHLVGAFAAGTTRPGAVLDSTGTAAVVLLIDDGFHPRPPLFAAGFESYAFVVPGTYVVIGYINAAGGAVDWLVRLLWPDGALEDALRAAAAAPLGSAGATWLPHLIGSGTPQADEASRAALVGVRPEHDRGHLLRALLEGLAFWLRENLEVAEASLGTLAGGEVLAIGGATHSGFWNQLKADVTGRPFRVPRIEESVALGAALLAGLGAGTFADAEAAVGSLRVESDCFQPDAAASAAYRRRYETVYRRLYPALREVSAAIEALQHA